jgi:hypothetical protein
MVSKSTLQSIVIASHHCTDVDGGSTYQADTIDQSGDMAGRYASSVWNTSTRWIDRGYAVLATS